MGVFIFAFCIFYFRMHKFGDWVENANTTLFTIIFLISCVYFLPGPYQPTSFNDVTICFRLTNTQIYKIIEVSSRVCGRIDRHAGFVYAAGYISIERLLSNIIPTWAVYGLFKVSAYSLIFAGMRLCDESSWCFTLIRRSDGGHFCTKY